MSEISLYRKYRPQNFKNLVGQDHIKTTLLNAFQENHVSHAYLFCGPRGTGKTSTARLLAKALNCLNPGSDADPCNECEICMTITDGTLIDLIEIDAASNRGIDEIRELKDKINFAPTRAKSKVYIIDEVHMLTKEAFNALLKTLEEPPSHAFFILATTEAHKIPETIISRCQRFDFKRITKQDIKARLNFIAGEEGIDAEESAIDAIAHTAEGGLRDAIGFVEQLTIDGKLTFQRVQDVLGISGQSTLETLFINIEKSKTQDALNEIQSLYAQGLDLIQITKDFLEFLRVRMIEATNRNDLTETHKLLLLISRFQEAYNRLKSTTIPQLPLEIAIIESTIQISNTPQPAEQSAAQYVMASPAAHAPQTIAKPAIQPEVKNEVNSAMPLSQKDGTTASTKEEPSSQEREHGRIMKNISEQEPEAEKEKQTLSFNNVKEHWPRVLELIKTPFIKMSLKEGVPCKVEEKTVFVQFTSNFHKENIDTAEKKNEIETALNSVFEGPVKIEYEVRKIELSTTQTEDDLPSREEDLQEDKTPTNKSLADEVLDIFEGEYIKD